MDTHATHWPEESNTSFDVELIDAISAHTDRVPTDLPTIGDIIDLDAITTIVQAETPTYLAFDVEIPGIDMGVDGEPDTTVTVILKTGPDDPVHITVTDEDQEPGGVGTAPRVW